jgi:hypothetical protein
MKQEYVPNPLNRTKTIGIKVTEAAFQTLRKVAEDHQKPLGEWCRDTLLALASGRGPSPFELALMAELTATQAILIDMLCALGRDGRITTQKAQEIVDRAHNAKYQEAIELLRYAYSRAGKFRLSAVASSERPPKENEHDR